MAILQTISEDKYDHLYDIDYSDVYENEERRLVALQLEALLIGSVMSRGYSCLELREGIGKGFSLRRHDIFQLVLERRLMVSCSFCEAV